MRIRMIAFLIDSDVKLHLLLLQPGKISTYTHSETSIEMQWSLLLILATYNCVSV
jgi:hypothetical protein